VTAQLVIAPILVPLVGIVGLLALRRRPRVQRGASVGIALAYAGSVAWLTYGVVLGPAAPGAAAYQLGGWPAPIGITLVADALSAFMLSIAATVGLAAVAFSVVYVDRANQRAFYHPLFHCLLLGVSGAFLTGDLFNLFVWFEVMLLASYVFVAFYGGATHTAAAFRYLTLNVIGSVVMLLAIGGLYATTGTLNMADMARRLAAPTAYGVDPAPVVGLGGLLLATFGLKAGLVPFQFWVPDAYRAAPLPVTAMLAGVTKKVGLYAIVRLYFTVFAAADLAVELPGVSGDSALAAFAPILMAMGIASVLVGGLGAVARDTLDELFAYSSIGQVGFIAIPIAVAAAADPAPSGVDPATSLRGLAVAAALVYALHHALAKGLLFMATGAVRSATGTNRLADLGGLAERAPVLAGAFFVGGLSMVGIPPLAGFFGKFLTFGVASDWLGLAIRGGGAVWPPAVALAVLLAGAVLTIVYVTRAWNACFWGERTPMVAHAVVDRREVAIVAAMAVAILAVGVAFDPVYRFASDAAVAALDRGAYVDVVAPTGGESA